MRRTDFNKLKKTKTPLQIKTLYANYLISLTEKQLNELIERKR